MFFILIGYDQCDPKKWDYPKSIEQMRLNYSILVFLIHRNNEIEFA